mmetsp:Transcript_52129/g.124165  ORF Transcript_52129/g.124165 Transcript_52129/m.124165 type:complete len:227 (-) Transcript_52129:739-1419(-)
MEKGQVRDTASTKRRTWVSTSMAGATGMAFCSGQMEDGMPASLFMDTSLGRQSCAGQMEDDTLVLTRTTRRRGMAFCCGRMVAYTMASGGMGRGMELASLWTAKGGGWSRCGLRMHRFPRRKRNQLQQSPSRPSSLATRKLLESTGRKMEAVQAAGEDLQEGARSHDETCRPLHRQILLQGAVRESPGDLLGQLLRSGSKGVRIWPASWWRLRKGRLAARSRQCPH